MKKHFGAKKLIFMKSLLILIRASRKVLKNFKINGFLLIFRRSIRNYRPNFMQITFFFFKTCKGGPFSLFFSFFGKRVPPLNLTGNGLKKNFRPFPVKLRFLEKIKIFDFFSYFFGAHVQMQKIFRKIAPKFIKIHIHVYFYMHFQKKI